MGGARPFPGSTQYRALIKLAPAKRMSKAEGAEGFICPYCLVSFNSSNKLQAHFIDFHSGEDNDAAVIVDTDSTKVCADMYSTFSDPHNVNKMIFEAFPRPVLFFELVALKFKAGSSLELKLFSDKKPRPS